MKTKNTKYILLLIFSFLLYSCEKEIEFSGDITKPMLVLNGFITPDSLIRVHVSKSKFFLQDDTSFENVNDADVNVWVDDVLIEKLSSIGDGYYLSSFKPEIGKNIKITAKKAGLTEVSTSTDVLSPISILAIDTTNHELMEFPIIYYYGDGIGPDIADTVGIQKYEVFDLNIRFKDPVSIKNYYKLDVKILNYYDNDSTSISDALISSSDVVFGNSNGLGPLETNTYSYFQEFSDELFNGKEYNLIVYFNSNTQVYYDITKDRWGDPFVEEKKPVKQELVIELKSISYSYYQYLRTRSASVNLIEFLSEPVQIYSNINGGIGIFGSYSSSISKIELK